MEKSEEVKFVVKLNLAELTDLPLDIEPRGPLRKEVSEARGCSPLQGKWYRRPEKQT